MGSPPFASRPSAEGPPILQWPPNAFRLRAAPSRALDADSLVIRDASGNARIELGTSEDHSPILRMLGGGDSDNKPSVVLSSDQKGSSLTFFWGKGLVMLSNDNESPSLSLSGPEGGTSIKPALVETGDRDNFHTIMGKIATVDDRTGSTTWSTAASLKLVRKDGKVLWQAP